MRNGTGTRRGKIKLLVLLAVSLVVGGGATYGFFGRPHPGARKPGAAAAKKAAPSKPVDISYVELGTFLVNLSAQDRLRYLRAEVTLGVAPPESAKKKKEGEGEKKADAPKLPPGDDARARDVIVQVLSRQSFDRLRMQGPDGELRKVLLDELSRQMKQTKVVSVLFTSFVMQ